jgi:hypothetical protein
MKKSTHDMQSNPVRDVSVIPVRGALIGSFFTIVWFVAIACGFAFLLHQFDADRAFVSTLVWPVIAAALGVPLIVFLWFGGISIVVGLARTREHLEKLGDYVQKFDDMEAKSQEISTKMNEASEPLTNAANSFSAASERFINEILPELEKANRGHEETGKQASTAPADSEDQDLKRKKKKLGRLINRADTLFFGALAKRNEAPGKGNRRIVVPPGGTEKPRITKILESENHLEPERASVLKEIYDLDVRTRSTGRKTLEESKLDELDQRLTKIENANFQ